MGMEVVAQVLLGPKFPALFYFCGEWDGVSLASHERLDLAVALLDKAYASEVRVCGEEGVLLGYSTISLVHVRTFIYQC